MCECLSAHIGKQTLEVLEENFDPDNLFCCLKHPRYHSSLCDCETEMFGVLTSNGDLIINKRCKTHNVICSKSGWELGWWAGTDSRALNLKNFDYAVCECGRKFIKTTYNDMCHRCEHLKLSDKELRAKQDTVMKDRSKLSKIKYLKRKGLTDMEIDNIFREEDKKRLNNLL